MANTAVGEVVNVAVHELEPWPGLNPRKRFDDARLAELAASITERGVLQNLVASPAQDGSDKLWIVAGESRWRSAGKAISGWEEFELPAADREIKIPVRIVPLTEGEALAIAMLENVQRQNLTPVEEARGFARLLELNGWTQSKLAEELLGSPKRQPYVANRLRLLELPDRILEILDEGHIQASHARDLILPLMKLEPAVITPALDGVVAWIAEQVEAGETVQGPALEAAVSRAREAAIQEYGSEDLFGEKVDAAAAPTPEFVPAEEEDMGDPPPDEDGQRRYLVRKALTTHSPFSWPALIRSDPGDSVIRDRIHSASIALRGETVRVKGAGTYRMSGGGAPTITIATIAGERFEHLTGIKLYDLVREIFATATEAPQEPTAWELARGYDIHGNPVSAAPVAEAPPAEPAPAPDPEPEPTPEPQASEAPKPAPKPAAKPAPAPAPAAPPSDPVSVLPAPDAGREAIPEGAGLITAILAATGRRPSTISITPIPDGRIAVTVAPRPLKTGETPLARTGTLEELEASIVAVIDSHFTR